MIPSAGPAIGDAAFPGYPFPHRSSPVMATYEVVYPHGSGDVARGMGTTPRGSDGQISIGIGFAWAARFVAESIRSLYRLSCSKNGSVWPIHPSHWGDRLPRSTAMGNRW